MGNPAEETYCHPNQTRIKIQPNRSLSTRFVNMTIAFSKEKWFLAVFSGIGLSAEQNITLGTFKKDFISRILRIFAWHNRRFNVHGNCPRQRHRMPRVPELI